ncbi:DUF3313 domain-containing protein [Myxococcota bacterium]|nr:DUF3313 domain-containing protein [Myxococcota bacterium]
MASLGLMMTLGCHSLGPGWQVDPERGAQASSAGLAPVRFSGFQKTQLKPGEDFARYETIALEPPTLTFKSKPRNTTQGLATNNRFPIEPNFVLSTEEKASVLDDLTEMFTQELRRSQEFRWVEEPMPGSLVVEAALVDVVMKTPLGLFPGGESRWIRTPAVMTLVLTLREAGSDEILARVVERRSALQNGTTGTTLAYSSGPVENFAAFRNTFDHWAFVFRTRLDATKARARGEDEQVQSLGARGSSPS